MHPNLHSALRRATNEPLRTSFLWNLGDKLADIATGLIKLVLTLIIVGSVIGGTWALMKRDPQPTAKPSSTSQSFAGHGRPTKQ